MHHTHSFIIKARPLQFALVVSRAGREKGQSLDGWYAESAILRESGFLLGVSAETQRSEKPDEPRSIRFRGFSARGHSVPP